jgi:hypothetical protein
MESLVFEVLKAAGGWPSRTALDERCLSMEALGDARSGLGKVRAKSYAAWRG